MNGPQKPIFVIATSCLVSHVFDTIMFKGILNLVNIVATPRRGKAELKLVRKDT